MRISLLFLFGLMIASVNARDFSMRTAEKELERFVGEVLKKNRDAYKGQSSRKVKEELENQLRTAGVIKPANQTEADLLKEGKAPTTREAWESELKRLRATKVTDPIPKTLLALLPDNGKKPKRLRDERRWVYFKISEHYRAKEVHRRMEGNKQRGEMIAKAYAAKAGGNSRALISFEELGLDAEAVAYLDPVTGSPSEWDYFGDKMARGKIEGGDLIAVAPEQYQGGYLVVVVPAKVAALQENSWLEFKAKLEEQEEAARKRKEEQEARGDQGGGSEPPAGGGGGDIPMQEVSLPPHLMKMYEAFHNYKKEKGGEIPRNLEAMGLTAQDLKGGDGSEWRYAAAGPKQLKNRKGVLVLFVNPAARNGRVACLWENGRIATAPEAQVMQLFE